MKMAPRSGSRYTYGSTEDLSASRSPSQSRAPITQIDDDDASSSYGQTSAKTVQGSRSWIWVRLAAACAVALGVVMISVRSSSKKTIENSVFIEHDVDERTTPVMHHTVQELISVAEVDYVIPKLSFTALNFYHIRDGKPAQDYPWLKDIKLIEPYRETTLTVTSPRPGHHYKWELPTAGKEDELHTSAGGVEAIAILTKLEDNTISLKELDSDGNVVRQLDETVMVKYVRREMRTLTDDERNELFDAMLKMWEVRVKDGNGREVFGDGYSDIWAINRLHYKAASPQECDHFHDGLGFLTNHALISNTFEYSLQAINPKLTLPYWDFTIETSSAGGGDYDGTDVESQIMTPVIQESWFGTVDHVDNMVKDGRWAYTPIPRMMRNNPGGVDPDVYSKLRAPWNVNDRAYLTRGLGKMCHANIDEEYPWPTCSMHYELATEYDNFYDWIWGSMYDPHGPVHIWIGGVLDCEGLYKKIGEMVGMDIADDLALVAFIHRKNLFREGFFYCDGSVDVDVAPEKVYESGVCGCLDYDLTQGDDFQAIFDTMYLMNYYLGDEDDDTKRKVVELICSNTINDGDHLQASSSLDPSFWATHPTMERLWMFSVLTGRVTDFKWPDSDIEITDSDGTTYTESISLYTDSCVGHRGSDVFPYDLLSSDADDFTVRTGIKGNPDEGGNIFTNREALAAFDPRINSLPYVYDTFKWLHCEEDGYNLDDAWMTRGNDASEASGVKNIKVNADTTWGDSGAGVEAHAAKTGRRTRFEKDAPKYPLYGRLKKITADMKKEAMKGREL